MLQSFCNFRSLTWSLIYSTYLEELGASVATIKAMVNHARLNVWIHKQGRGTHLHWDQPQAFVQETDQESGGSRPRPVNYCGIEPNVHLAFIKCILSQMGFTDQNCLVFQAQNSWVLHWTEMADLAQKWPNLALCNGCSLQLLQMHRKYELYVMYASCIATVI